MVFICMPRPIPSNELNSLSTLNIITFISESTKRETMAQEMVSFEEEVF